MYFVKFLPLFVVLLTVVAVVKADPIARLVGGQKVDSLHQFPHHVYVLPYGGKQKCGGSILNQQWVITSATCVKGIQRVDLHFGKQFEYDQAAPYYSVSVNQDNIHIYPTEYDDLALIKLPTRLVFSDTVKPINISRLSIAELRNRFAVMPGFGTPTTSAPASTPSGSLTTKPPLITSSAAPIGSDDTLRYGMFNIVGNSVCKNLLQSAFNEYGQLCIEGWTGTSDAACDNDNGNGLIIGYPSKSELVSLYSMYSPAECRSNNPGVFTYLAKYLPWIEATIQDVNP